MTTKSHRTLVPQAGYSPLIGLLVGMMTDAREKVISFVAGLSVEQLDHRYDAHSNSIGVLLGHLIARELHTQSLLFGQTLVTSDEENKWKPGMRLWDRARFEFRDFPATHYIAGFASVRRETLAELADRDDQWLSSFVPGLANNCNACYLLYHLLEDELHHCGQILWLRNRLDGLHPSWWEANATDVPPNEARAPMPGVGIDGA